MLQSHKRVVILNIQTNKKDKQMQKTIEFLGQEYTYTYECEYTEQSDIPASEEFTVLDVDGTHGSVDPELVGEMVELETDDVFMAFSNPQTINISGKPYIFKSLLDYIVEMRG